MNPKQTQKQELEEQIKKIFLKNPSSIEVKKAKKLAMSKNIKLGNLKKKFCKKCFTFFTSNNSEVRIKKPLKIIKCKNCGSVGRYRLRRQ